MRWSLTMRSKETEASGANSDCNEQQRKRGTMMRKAIGTMKEMAKARDISPYSQNNYNQISHFPLNCINNKQKMGADHPSSSHATDLHLPPLDQYSCTRSTPHYFLWEHIYQREALIEIQSDASTSQLRQALLSMYWMRQRHHLFVSTLYFQQPENSPKARIFYERVFTNLARIKDIPFRDSLQLYYVGLKGFEILYNTHGFFHVTEEMFHLTERRKVKVWLDKDISRLAPETPSQAGSESDMVKRVIQIIDENVDHSGQSLPLGSILFSDSNTFKSAISRFREVCRNENYIIPETIQCLEYIYEGDLGRLLDQYSSGQDLQQPVTKPPTPSFEQRLVGLSHNYPQNPPQTSPSNVFRPAPSIVSQSSTNRKTRGLQLAHSPEIRQNPPTASRSIQYRPNLNGSRTRGGIHYGPNIIHIESPIKTLNSCHFQNHPNFLPAPPIMPQRANSVTRQRPSSINYQAARNPSPEYRIVVKPISTPTPQPPPRQNYIPPQQSNQFLHPQVNYGFQRPPMYPQPPSNPKLQIQNSQSSLNILTNAGERPLNKTFSKTFTTVGRSSSTDSDKENVIVAGRSFEDFKKNFKYSKEPQSDNLFTKPDFWKGLETPKETNLTKNNCLNRDNERLAPNITPSSQKQGFFLAPLHKKATVVSHEDDERHYEVETTKTIRDASNSPIFPSVTDISDNYSFLTRDGPTSRGRVWREDESAVVKHNPDDSCIRLPEDKVYQPKIDDDIWQDILQMKKRRQNFALA